MTSHPIPLNFLIYEENFLLFFQCKVYPWFYIGGTSLSEYGLHHPVLLLSLQGYQVHAHLPAHSSQVLVHKLCTAKKKCRKFETNIPRKGISGPQSQFPHSYVCERIIYSHDGSAFSAGGNMWTNPGNI
jgi:hypothetical protein